MGTFQPELEEPLNMILERVFASLYRTPAQFRVLFINIRNAASSRFPDDPQVPYLSVNGFLFLRLICPAIISPSLFGILDFELDENTTKAFRA